MPAGSFGVPTQARIGDYGRWTGTAWEPTNQLAAYDTNFTLGTVDLDKIVRFSLGGISSGSSVVITLPNGTQTLAALGLQQTWTQRQTFGDVTFGVTPVWADGVGMTFNTTTGTKIGTQTNEKIGFWNTAPIIQPAHADQAAPAAQSQTTITDSTAGTPGTTLAAVTGLVYADDVATLRDWAASLAAELALIKTDVANIKTFQNAARTALVNAGLIKGSA